MLLQSARINNREGHTSRNSTDCDHYDQFDHFNHFDHYNTSASGEFFCVPVEDRRLDRADTVVTKNERNPAKATAGAVQRGRGSYRHRVLVPGRRTEPAHYRRQVGGRPDRAVRRQIGSESRWRARWIQGVHAQLFHSGKTITFYWRCAGIGFYSNSLQFPRTSSHPVPVAAYILSHSRRQYKIYKPFEKVNAYYQRLLTFVIFFTINAFINIYYYFGRSTHRIPVLSLCHPP